MAQSEFSKFSLLFLCSQGIIFFLLVLLVEYRRAVFKYMSRKKVVATDDNEESVDKDVLLERQIVDRANDDDYGLVLRHLSKVGVL